MNRSTPAICRAILRRPLAMSGAADLADATRRSPDIINRTAERAGRSGAVRQTTEALMADTKFIAIYDTYCGWCYGAAPILSALAASNAEVEVLHRHLFQGPNAHRLADGFGRRAAQFDARIAELTGQPFGRRYFEDVLQSETEILASALTAQAAALVHDRGAAAELRLSD